MYNAFESKTFPFLRLYYTHSGKVNLMLHITQEIYSTNVILKLLLTYTGDKFIYIYM
jgi:hypothetical protein